MNAPELIPLEVKVQHPSAAALARGADAALELVRSFEITDDATYGLAAEELQSIKSRAARLDEQRKGITKPMDEAKAAVMNLFRGPLDLLSQAEGILKGKMLTWQRAVEAKAREEQMAREKAAAEERARLQAEADKLAEQGRSGEAEVKRQVADLVVAAPVAAPAPPAVKGIATRETVDFEVDSIAKLIAFIAFGDGEKPLAKPELVALLGEGDSVKIRAYVKGLGLQCNLPGVRVFTKQTLASRRG